MAPRLGVFLINAVVEITGALNKRAEFGSGGESRLARDRHMAH